MRSTTLFVLPLSFLAACGEDALDSEAIEVLVEGCCDGCDDSGTGGTTGGGSGTPTGSPIASTNVEVVDLGIVCGDATATFTLYNTGDGVLEVENITVDGDWEVTTGVGSVEPGSSVDITLVGSGGAGSVTISTNDPNQSTLIVDILAEANQPPTLALGSNPPVIAPGALEQLSAIVDDDQGPTRLAMTWESDVDGVLSTDGADSDGLASIDWDGALQSSGSHMVTVTAVDECGEMVSDTFTVCQNLGYTEETLDISSWQFTGSAEWDSTNGWLELTDTSRYIAGTAFSTADTVSSDNVSIGFMFYASGGSSSGADGLSLTAIDTTRMTTYQGQNGGAIGYGGLPGWSIEVDTWDNTGDPGLSEPTTVDHVSFVIDGASNGVGEVYAEIHEVEDGQWHEMQVDVVGQHVTVSIDGIVYIDESVSGITSFPAHVGFTAATGNVTNNHFIDALTVERFVCDG